MSLRDTIAAAVNGVAAGVTTRAEAQEILTQEVCSTFQTIFANLDVTAMQELNHRCGLCVEFSGGKVSGISLEQ